MPRFNVLLYNDDYKKMYRGLNEESKKLMKQK